MGGASVPANTYKFDLFVSYAAIDNASVAGGQAFVAQFVHDLQASLHQFTGRPPRIWCDLNRFDTASKQKATDALLSSAFLIPILSPAFLTSETCAFELSSFVESAGQDRVIKVAKFPAKDPFPLPDLVAYQFFRRTNEGLMQGLTGDQYRRALDNLAQQIALLLDSIVQPNPVASSRDGGMTVFLCHSSHDKHFVRDLWKNLKADGFTPWLDEKELLPGQKWELAIREAIDQAGAIVVCLSRGSINKEGFLQREIRQVLDKAAEVPDHTIFLIPARLEECAVPPRLKEFQWVDLFESSGYSQLVQALRIRAQGLERSGHVDP